MCLATSRIVAVLLLVLTATAFTCDRARGAEDVNDAAPIYLKLLERLPEKGSTDSDFLNEGGSIAIQGPVVRFLMSHDETAQQLHAAAQRGRCEWPAEVEGPLLLKFRRLSDLEQMRIRWAIELERPDDALREASDTMVFARFVGRTPEAIARLLAAGIADEMTVNIATCLPVASDQSLAELQKRLGALPRWFTAAEVIEGDGKWCVSKLKKLDEAKRPDLFATSSMLYDITGGDHPNALLRTQIQQVWDDPSKRLAAITLISSRYSEAAKIVAMPRMLVAKATDEWDQKLQKADVLTKTIVPSGKTLQKVHSACLLSDVRAAMLQAAVTGRISGTDAAMKTLDPLTGKPFKLHEWKEGFELQSDVLDTSTGKPLKITVGKAEKLPF